MVLLLSRCGTLCLTQKNQVNPPLEFETMAFTAGPYASQLQLYLIQQVVCNVCQIENQQSQVYVGNSYFLRLPGGC